MDSYRISDAHMAPPRTDEQQALQPSHLENVAQKLQGAQATRSAAHKDFAPHAQQGSWGSQESDDMDCDDEESSSLSQRMGMPIAIRGGGNHVKMMPSLSNGSIASTVSSAGDNEHDGIPELSQSLGSTTSFDLRTPIKPAHNPLLHGEVPSKMPSKSSSPQKFNLPGAGANDATATWRESLSLSPESNVAALSYDAQEQQQQQPRRASDEGRSLQQRVSLSQSLGLNLNPTATTTTPPVKLEQLSGISEEGGSTSGDIAMRRISQRIADGKSLAPGAAGRLTISLPPSGTSFARANMPHTPGGSAFTGARDGAATGGPPLSPFEPPTPLCMPNGPSPFGGLDAPSTPSNAGYVAPRRPQQKRASLPHITPIRTPPAPSRPAMQRNGSVGMSPLSMEFASAVSMKRSAADDAVSNSGSSSTSGRATDSQHSSTLSVSSTSSGSTLLTPPYSPLSQPKSLLDLDASSSSTLLERRSSSADSNGSASKKRNVGLASISVSPSGLARSLSATRPKQAKAKVSPYPLREESAAPAMQAPSPTSSTYFAVPQQRSPIAAPAAQLEPSGVPMAPKLTAPKMEKSMSAPAVPQTVSARHLQHRTLHAGFSSAYTFGDELGSGGFGFVVSATRNHDGLPVAVKFIWKDKVPTHGWVRDPHLGVVPMEAFVLKVVDHPSVVKFIELFSDDDFFYLVMELHGTPWKAPGADDDKPAAKPVAPVAKLPLPSSTPVSSGGLRSQPMQMSKSQPNALRSPSVAIFPPGSNVPQAVEADAAPVSASALSPKLTAALRPAPMERRSSCDLFECIEQHSRLSEDKARWVFAQVVEAVFHLDRLGITHRDIKDENCVVDADFNVKLIDFGSAVISDPRKPPPYFNRFFGTMTFASSEILQGQPYRAPQAEIWSLGVLLSILLSGECPFADPTAAIRGKISKPKGNWSPDALNLLMGCLEVNPDHRATIAQVREHPWVSCAWELRGRARPQ